MKATKSAVMGIFERWLSLWVGLCILAGIALGSIAPGVFSWLAALEAANVNFVVAALIWLMIYRMMVQVDFASLGRMGGGPKGLVITLVVNWVVKPLPGGPSIRTWGGRFLAMVPQVSHENLTTNFGQPYTQYYTIEYV